MSTSLPAVRAVWLVLTILTSGVILTSFFATPEAIYRTVPQCASRARGSSCVLCGMTTAFFRVAQGDLAGAWTAHRGGIPLYILFCSNSLLAIFLGGRRCRF